MPSFLALDLGTSFIKGAVLDLDDLRIRSVHRVPFPAPVPGLPPRFHEVDPTAVVAATHETLARLAAIAPDAAGVVACSQMQGLILADQYGAPVSNCITWRDQRGLLPHKGGQGSRFDALVSRLSAGQRAALGELHPGLPPAVLFWLAEEGQLPNDATPASLPDWILGRLCETPGRPRVELTNASVHGPLDLERLEWQPDILESWGLAGLRWPEPCRAGEVLGLLGADLPHIPCFVPVGDQPCSLAGALLREDELSLNISTGSQASRITTALRRGPYQTRPYFDGQYLNLITHVPAGRSLSVLMSLLTELADAEGSTLHDPWETAGRLAAEAGPTDLEVNLAFFASLAGDRGSITNIREDNLTVGQLFRAAFQDMAGHYQGCALRLSPDRDWQRVAFSGGLAQKIPVLRDVICARLNATYRLAPTSEDSLLGLLALALVCRGREGTVAAAIAHLASHYSDATSRGEDV